MGGEGRWEVLGKIMTMSGEGGSGGGARAGTTTIVEHTLKRATSPNTNLTTEGDRNAVWAQLNHWDRRINMDHKLQ